MKMNLDMAQDSPCCGPEPMNMREPYYPSFHYSGDKPMDLPKEGTMTIRFRKASSSESEGRDGKERYECTVDVLEILSAEGSEKRKFASKETEEALDALAKEESDNYEED